MSMNISINSYTGYLGGTRDNFIKYDSVLTSVMNDVISKPRLGKIRVYDLEGDRHNHNSGTKGTELIIYNNATMNDVTGGYREMNDIVEIEGLTYPEYKKFLKQSQLESDVINIESSNGIIIAQFFPERYELNILFDMFPTYDAKYVFVFKYLMHCLQTIFDEESNESMWKKAKSRDSMITQLKSTMEEGSRSRLSDIRRKLERDTNDLESYRRSLKTIADKVAEGRRKLDSEVGYDEDVLNRILKDLDSIVAFEKVKDVLIEPGSFTVFTEPLTITSDRGLNYKGGSFEIKLNLNNSDVRFKGTEARQGYWTSHDPHPHVNGENGQPCWGSLASTIAELSSQNELFALVLFCIDYLESANTQDTAGKRVVNWVRLDEDGDEIGVQSDDMCTCTNCGSQMHEDDGELVYNVYYACHDELEGENFVCQECREDNYWYNEDAGYAVNETIDECGDCYEDRVNREQEEIERVSQTQQDRDDNPREEAFTNSPF